MTWTKCVIVLNVTVFKHFSIHLCENPGSNHVSMVHIFAPLCDVTMNLSLNCIQKITCFCLQILGSYCLILTA